MVKAWKTLIILAAGWAALAAGCGSDPVPGGACVTNQNCLQGEQCVGGRCISASRPGCKNDDACGIGEYCDLTDGACKIVQVTGCTNDEPCPPSQRCNTLTGVCIDGRRSCTEEAQCTAIGRHCNLDIQQCVECVEAAHCDPGDTCVEGHCTEPSTSMCTSDPQCAPPSTVCEAQRCVAGCGRPGSPISCGPGEFCNTNTGRCEAGQVTCTGDVQCSPPNSICESGQCIPGCTQVGGLVCTGGNVCNAGTGRCEPPAGCTQDSQCGAPARVCEAGQCVAGCATPGGLTCGSGTVCDNTTGRCTNVQGPCTGDPQCGAPARVCESGQCVPGCAEIGGIQCSGQTVCNQGTGRCEQGGMFCTSDAQCGAPAQVCNLQTGACIPGCGTAGCPTGQTCNAGTGRCEMTPAPGGTVPLNGVCGTHSDCASNVCFAFGGSVGSRCIQSCGSSADCPASFTCYDFDGGKMCVSSQLFSGATFSTAHGSSCSTGGQCRSNFCPNNQCVESCSETSDCPGGQCQWYEFVPSRYIAACNGPRGTRTNGQSCTAESQCRSGVCYGSGICGDLCGSSSDCPNGNLCLPVNYSVCTLDLIFACLQWEPNFVKACVQGTHGTAPMGSQCSNPNGSNCRDGFCFNPTNQCTGVCSRNADCPSGMVCGVEEYGDLDGTTIYLNVCVPR